MKTIVTAIAILSCTFAYADSSKDYARKRLKECTQELKLHMANYDHLCYMDYLEGYAYLQGKIKAYEDMRDNG